MNVRSVFLQKRSSPRLAAALLACLLSPGAAAAQNPIADKVDSAAPREHRRPCGRSHGRRMDAAHGRQHRARRAAQADYRSRRSSDGRFPHSYAEFHRHHDVRRLAAGRASPPARAAASQGALHQRTPVVRPAGASRAGDHRALQRSDVAREARDEQAGADLHPVQRSRPEGARVAEEPEGGAHPPDAQLGHVAGGVSADAPRPELRW